MTRQSLTGSAVLVLAAVGAVYGAKQASDALFRSKLSKDQEVVHALNRLTFGPRPGDVAQVRKVGVKKWAVAQLYPERIQENPELVAKLAPLDSLTMSTKDLVENYPPPQIIVGYATGRLPMPSDPEKRARVERLAHRYQNRLSKAKKGDTSKVQPAQSTPLRDLLSPQELAALRNGTPDERAAMLSALPDEKLGTVLFSLPQNARQGLIATAPVAVRRRMLADAAPQQLVAHDLTEGKLYRAIYSNRQLQEVLADFWFNHFNVYLDKGADRYLTTEYEREAIRPHVLGKFRDLLEATAKSPAMLWYLDNHQSVSPDSEFLKRMKRARGRARGLNENYARELLELHSLGVDGGYTQKDVVEVARCLTGWTINEPYRGAEFQFNARMHDPGEKTVLGVTIPAGGGVEDGMKVLDIVAAHPSTARFISTKLAQRFVADVPPASLIDAMAKTFTRTQGDIREVLRTMLESREFWSQGAYRSKVKSPLEMVASAVRATSADVRFAFALANRISEFGQPLYRKQEPTGYSNSGEEWVNSAGLLARMNFAIALTGNKLPGVKMDTAKFPSDPALIARSLLFTDASRETRTAIEKSMSEKQDAASVAAVVLGGPEFQRR